MQLVKNTLLTPERTVTRKVKEVVLALRLERLFSKDKILKAYLNAIYFGKDVHNRNIYGIQAAAGASLASTRARSTSPRRRTWPG